LEVNKLQKLTGVIVLLLLSACGTTEVLQVRPNAYSVSAQYGSLNGSWTRAQQDAVSKAKEYCEQKGLVFEFISEKRDGTLGWTPQSSTIEFSCAPNQNELQKSATAQCKDEMQTNELDSIRDKVELIRDGFDSAVPFAIAMNDSFPKDNEKKAIAKWATIRETCDKRSNEIFTISSSATPLEVTQIQQDRSFAKSAVASINELIVSLYQQKLTYGEFAKKRYEISKTAADTERQFRLSIQNADQQHQMEAKQLAQQQYQNKLMAWATYQQSVNARQPQTVHLDGGVRVQTNCISNKMGNMINTNCN
jgi:hypothetical protein